MKKLNFIFLFIFLFLSSVVAQNMKGFDYQLKKFVPLSTDISGRVLIGGFNYSNDAIPFIENEHYYLHKGKHFSIKQFSTLATNDTLSFVITNTDSTLSGHFIWSLNSTQNTEEYFYKAPAFTADGTLIQQRNNNLNFSDTLSVFSVRLNPTISNKGTELFKSSFGVSGSAVNSRNGIVQRSDEIVVPPLTSVLLKIVSKGSGNIFDYGIYWYED